MSDDLDPDPIVNALQQATLTAGETRQKLLAACDDLARLHGHIQRALAELRPPTTSPALRPPWPAAFPEPDWSTARQFAGGLLFIRRVVGTCLAPQRQMWTRNGPRSPASDRSVVGETSRRVREHHRGKPRAASSRKRSTRAACSTS